MSLADDEGELEESIPGPVRRASEIRYRTRTAKQVIDQAIAENRPGERILYGFAVVLVAGGMITLIAG